MARAARGSSEHFSAALRRLCAARPSVSAICRDIGINRQQFERYLTGAAMPSAHNLRRICAYFSLDEAQLLAGPPTAGSRSIDRDGLADPSPFAQALRPQPGELPLLRNYCGTYQYHFLTPSWPGQVQIGVMQFYEKERRILTRYLGRVRDPLYGTVTRSRFDGQAVLRGDRIFVLEYSRGVIDSFGQSILFPAHRHNANYLTGMTFGIGWHPHRGPFSSQVILRRLRPSQPLQEAVAQCGLYAPDSRSLDPIVRNHFAKGAMPYMTGQVLPPRTETMPPPKDRPFGR